MSTVMYLMRAISAMPFADGNRSGSASGEDGTGIGWKGTVRRCGRKQKLAEMVDSHLERTCVRAKDLHNQAVLLVATWVE